MAVAAVALTVQALAPEDGTYKAVKWNQVDNRTQRTDWALDIYWKVVEEEVDGKN